MRRRRQYRIGDTGPHADAQREARSPEAQGRRAVRRRTSVLVSLGCGTPLLACVIAVGYIFIAESDIPNPIMRLYWWPSPDFTALRSVPADLAPSTGFRGTVRAAGSGDLTSRGSVEYLLPRGRKAATIGRDGSFKVTRIPAGRYLLRPQSDGWTID